MPKRRKVTTKKSVQKTKSKPVKSVRKTRVAVQTSYAQKFRSVRWTESYSSFLLGIVVVIVAVLFGVTLIRQQSHIQQTTSLSTGPTPSVTPSPTPGTTISENGKTYYFVKENDSLYAIAQRVYSSGDKWVDIAKANNLANPSTIFTGDKLLLPNAPQPSTLGQIVGQTQTDKITANTYTVKKEDTLWDIAIRAYGDGYSWVKIAKANNLANPDLIFSGNVLQIPR